ncbi:DNA-binding protein HU [termite gut metagenome]|uniref:DNA-binding protein HU n=1 Tax=termite gut metagenome TaxID=433724 RepID=A0A5J4SWF0_9ZZZZ
MNNKEYILELSKRSGYSIQETTELVASLFADITQHLQNEKAIAIQHFGSFEVKEKAERISINPITKKRMLTPPKLVLTYKPSTSLKEKFK